MCLHFCRRIGKDLSNTFAKLEKLTICKSLRLYFTFFVVVLVYIIVSYLYLVAKRKSLFDDKAVEIEELTYIIKQVSVFFISRYTVLYGNEC